MKKRFRLIRRGVRRGKFYCVDSLSGKRTSLQTTGEEEAAEIAAAKNHALRQPILNLQLAKAYLAGVDSGITTRTWRNAVDALIETKHGANQVRWNGSQKTRRSPSCGRESSSRPTPRSSCGFSASAQ